MLEIPNPKKVSDNQESSSISFRIGIAILMVILIYWYPNFIKLFRKPFTSLQKN